MIIITILDLIIAAANGGIAALVSGTPATGFIVAWLCLIYMKIPKQPA